MGRKIHCAPDYKKAKALEKAAKEQITLSELPPTVLFVNSYSALRKILEAKALKEGLKFYSHEIYVEYLQEKGFSKIAGKFDRYRKIRNNIEYEGANINKETAQIAHEEMKDIIIYLLRG